MSLRALFCTCFYSGIHPCASPIFALLGVAFGGKVLKFSPDPPQNFSELFSQFLPASCLDRPEPTRKGVEYDQKNFILRKISSQAFPKRADIQGGEWEFLLPECAPDQDGFAGRTSGEMRGKVAEIKS